MERTHSGLAVLVVAGLVGALASAAAAADDPGVKVFIEKRCYTCHTVASHAAEIEKQKAAFIKASGAEADEEGEDEKDSKGGDLSDVGAKRTAAWVDEILKNPKPSFKDTPECQRLAKQKDRKKFKGTPEELTALEKFLGSLKGEAKQAAGFTSCLKD
ncbi:MAG: c-type cytochrome [Myxococcales bacterium]|jgi:cbb3-type cytochrome oxidase cytochrome c subunit|nr:c-type cytochrome [Myxococcales bacterium]